MPMLQRGEHLEAWRRLLQVHAALIDRLERELVAEVDLPLPWYDVLVQLRAAPHHRLRLQQLVRSLLLSKSGITRLVDRMVEAGLIQRQVCPTDRRGAFAVLTDAGAATLERAAPVHLRGIQEHFGNRLNQADSRALVTAFDKLLAGTRFGADAGCRQQAARAADDQLTTIPADG